MELIKLLPATDEIDDIAKVPAVLFPDNMALQLESSYVNREHLLHGYLLKEAGKTLGGIAFYNNPGHYLEGEKACCVGYFHCINDVAAAKLLIDTVKKDAAALGISQIIGPLNGTTWENYRFRTSDSPPAFFLESPHPVYYNDLYTANGFQPIKTYYSFLVKPLRAMDERAMRREQQLLEKGITIRHINPENYAEDMRKLYDFSLVSFKENFLYTPYPWEAYIAKYRQLEGLNDPRMTVIAEHEGKVVGFVFMIEDYLCEDEKRVVFKTYAVHPGAKYAGLGAVISQRLTQDLMERGFVSAIHAFVIEGSTSLNSSAKDSEVYRTYKLYAIDLTG
jgi:L-amino acid N-acyltransferase YncA